MRAFDFITEDAVEELKNRLPKLDKHTYDTIDKLMQNISAKHKITGHQLHKLFIKKYGHTPDTWIKKYKEQHLAESVFQPVDNLKNIEEIEKFIKWSMKILNIQDRPKITLSNDTEQAQEGHHTGLHTDDGSIWVYIGNRNLVDIFRTIFHELVHQRQQELNMIKPNDSYPGSPIEMLADMAAGKYIKIYGKENPHIFQ